MADNCNLVSILGVLLILTIFDNPIIVYAGEGVPNVALFTFGDSYYDVGNKVFLSKDKNPAQTKWPYGKSRDDPNGKFSDGHIVPDFIADFMSIPNGVPPALKPDANVTRGVSFAVTDASILGSPVESKHPDADATKQQAFVTSVTSQLKTDIRSLTNLGARKFVVQLLAPLGCLPIVRQDYKTGNDCYELLNDLAKQHNEKIGPMLNDFANSPDGFQFAVFDFYDAIFRRTQRNLNYRFYVSNSSCCGVGTHNAYGRGKGNVHSKLCDYQRAYLFFDGRHNSEKAQEEIAHLLYSANLNVIQPMNIRELIVYPTGEKMREFWEPNTFSARRRLPSQDSYAGFYA
ncbi:PREDICTED: GDSL esterase/lipase ESM1-like isoform X1 [Camelina sativa]|uniref:GDSL esterase/lipase ESM1-like isoform X1 n=1 Tax=Camelina sativa TaxID=90675 RepID=A0ABM1R8P0_CAMSA|nr:PREDICTED: GDSL esterase/lipase ESM1-like isoform X1 [Camelina sativa]